MLTRLSRSFLQLFDHASGSFALRNLSYLKKVEYDQDRLERFQRGMLKLLLEFAGTHVPYYHDVFRKMGLNPRYEDPLYVLSKLPILTKDIFRSQHDRVISKIPLKYRVVQTSGSTGTPLRIFKDGTSESLGQASYYQGLMWYGYALGDPVVQLWGRRPVWSFREKFAGYRDWAINFVEFDAHSMSDSVMKKYLMQILRIRPKVLYGYVSSIELLCRFMNRLGVRTQIPAVVATAETLLGIQRDLFSSTVCKEVYNQYGCSEVTSVAFECPSHSCLHVMPKVLVEVVGRNGEDVGPGESGRILLTDLTNFKMPLIRYDPGDEAVKADKAFCSCGRVLRCIKSVEGRTSDIILGLNGNRVHGEFFSHLFESSGFAHKFGLAQFQVVQKTRVSLVVKFVLVKKPEEQDLAYLSEIISRYLGPVEITFEVVPEIPVLPGGKRRFTISELGVNS